MNVDEAFQLWNEMLTNLGDNYATQERFLRHYYNAFKAELPEIPNAPLATRTNLIRIHETLLSANIKSGTEALVDASRIYGRVTCVVETDSPTKLDDSLRQLMRAQGAPSYVLLMWLLSKQPDLKLSEDHLVQVTDRLTSFFVRRNLDWLPADLRAAEAVYDDHREDLRAHRGRGPPSRGARTPWRLIQR